MDKNSQEAMSRTKVRRAAIQTLENLKRAGVTHIAKATPKATETDEISRETDTAEGRRSHLPHEEPRSSAAEPASPRRTRGGQRYLLDADPATRSECSREDSVAALEVLQREVATCTRCKELASPSGSG